MFHLTPLPWVSEMPLLATLGKTELALSGFDCLEKTVLWDLRNFLQRNFIFFIHRIIPKEKFGILKKTRDNKNKMR